MRAHTEMSYAYRIGRVLAYLDDHVSEDLSVQELAKIAHFSQYHFHRVFKGVTGQSIHQCVRRLRLEAAARKLRRTNASVLEIALLVGFSSHEGFTRAFKRHFGESPSVYRAQPEARIVLAASREPLATEDVVVREVPAFEMVSWSHQGSFSEVPQAWEAFVGLMVSKGLFTGKEQLMGRYPDDPEITPDGQVRFEVGMKNPAPGPLPNPLFRRQIPAGRWAVATHRGSYTTLHDTYLRLVGGWFVNTNTALADGPCLEFYLNHPSEVPEEELVTEVWAPIGER